MSKASESSPLAGQRLSDDDAARRQLAIRVIEGSNGVAIDFAKHLVTLSFSAVGVVLALQDKWIEKNDRTARSLVAIALCVFIGAGFVSSLAIAGQRLRLSLSDYFDIDRQLAKAAQVRSILTAVATCLFGLGAVLAVVVALWA